MTVDMIDTEELISEKLFSTQHGIIEAKDAAEETTKT